MPTAAAPGTKAGPAGSSLVSTGLADLDLVLGGGMPLGSLLLLLEDSGCTQPATLLQYWLAEGVASGHQGLWVAPVQADLRLPRLSADQKAAKVTLLFSMGCRRGRNITLYQPCCRAGC